MPTYWIREQRDQFPTICGSLSPSNRSKKAFQSLHQMEFATSEQASASWPFKLKDHRARKSHSVFLTPCTTQRPKSTWSALANSDLATYTWIQKGTTST